MITWEWFILWNNGNLAVKNSASSKKCCCLRSLQWSWLQPPQQSPGASRLLKWDHTHKKKKVHKFILNSPKSLTFLRTSLQSVVCFCCHQNLSLANYVRHNQYEWKLWSKTTEMTTAWDILSSLSLKCLCTTNPFDNLVPNHFRFHRKTGCSTRKNVGAIFLSILNIN